MAKIRLTCPVGWEKTWDNPEGLAVCSKEPLRRTWGKPSEKKKCLTPQDKNCSRYFSKSFNVSVFESNVGGREFKTEMEKLQINPTPNPEEGTYYHVTCDLKRTKSKKEAISNAKKMMSSNGVKKCEEVINKY